MAKLWGVREDPVGPPLSGGKRSPDGIICEVRGADLRSGQAQDTTAVARSLGISDGHTLLR
jgi:hypothetical protein